MGFDDVAVQIDMNVKLGRIDLPRNQLLPNYRSHTYPNDRHCGNDHPRRQNSRRDYLAADRPGPDSLINH
ncbi:hypothetical protein D2E41_26610 [Mycobacteroides abscessus]|nr:hypothetical protein D2E41_26610 [Mycobacteroides abscessus]